MKTPKRLMGTQTPAHLRSRRQEREVAAQVGGRLTPGSGAGNEKGDVRVKGLARIEAKTTAKKSYALTIEQLAKIEKAALPSGEIPAMVIEFIDGKGRPLQSCAIVPLWALNDLIKTGDTK